jgi:Spy/CpxP family protein refolding chaperone
VNSWKVILATMVIFGTGVVTGGLLVRHADHGRDRRPQHATGAVRQAQPNVAGVMRIEFLRRMERELDLTPAQREPIDKVLQEGQERMKKLMDTVEPRRREVFKKTMDEFRAVLTPEQQKRFDDLVKQQQQRAREQRKAVPPRERPPQGPPATNTPAATNSGSSVL